jgi:hypothetical protein
MQLTRSQRRVLEVYRWYRLHPPTFQLYLSAMLWRSARWIYGGIFVVALLIVLLGRFAAVAGWIYLLLGVIVGVVIRDLLHYRQTIRIWPVFNTIIDWAVVETLLQGPAPERADTHDPA